MANTISAGEHDAVIDGENVDRIVTELRIRGADGVMTTNQGEADNGDGHLVEDGDDRTLFDPQGQTWYIANTDASADMEVHILFDGDYADDGGLS